MTDWRDGVVPPHARLLEVMQALERSPLHFAMVADARGVLLGTVTDGDVRRALLRGLGTDAPVSQVMNTQPVVLAQTDSREEALKLLRQHQIRQLPVVDEQRRVVGIEALETLFSQDVHDHLAVVMAGGQGRRLSPLTDSLPKPLVPVGGRPAIDRVIEGLAASGFRAIVVSVNYFAEMIIDYVGDGARWGVAVHYVREEEYLGTAGALAHIDPRPTSPFLVINADVMTRFDFRLLLDFHAHNRSLATMCVRQFELQVPYGVIRTEEQRLVGIEEKPVQAFLINAGIYLLDPSVLDEIPRWQPFDMTMLFARLMELRKPTHVFPLHEYWLDIGHMADLHQANADFQVG